MKKRLLITMLALSLSLALIAGGTMAWFTDSDESGVNSFAAGTLLVDIEEYDVEHEGFELDRLNPGDSWTYTFDVKNIGTKNFVYKVVICWQDILGNTLHDFAGKDYGTDPLSDIVEFTIKDSNGNELPLERLKVRNLHYIMILTNP